MQDQREAERNLQIVEGEIKRIRYELEVLAIQRRCFERMAEMLRTASRATPET